MFELDLRSRQPIYEQLAGKLKDLIIKGVMQTDEQLPSVRTLAGQLTINPNTIQKAYRELEIQGYIYSLPGKGNFVARAAPGNNEAKLAQIKEELSKLILEALYLGLSKETIIEFVSELNIVREGEEKVER